MKRKTKQVIKVSLLIIISFLFAEKNANAQCGVTSTSWCLLGNSGTTSTNYVGTIDPIPLIFKTTETEWMRITPSGNIGIFTIAPAYKLDVSGDINLTGALRIATAAGTAGQVLTSAGGGANTWTTPTNGTVTSVTGTLPISIASGTTTPAISITQAGNTIDGFLSSTDWNTFNNKITGNGTFNYIPKWTPDGTTLGNSSIFDNGNIGIGTTSPQANLEVKNGSVLFDGTTGNTPASGAGTRMMWVPSKAAFRAGVIGSTEWDATNIGIASVAFGYYTKANGNYSSAFGYNSTAQSYGSFVIGSYNIISGNSLLWVGTDPLFVIGNGSYSSGKVTFGNHAPAPIGGISPHNALTVLKNGSVGIGTPTPVNRLDVQGGVSIGTGYAGIKSAPGNGAIVQGNVGIGTATPTQTLDVNGRINVTNGVIQKGGAAITNTSDLGLYS